MLICMCVVCIYKSVTNYHTNSKMKTNNQTTTHLNEISRKYRTIFNKNNNDNNNNNNDNTDNNFSNIVYARMKISSAFQMNKNLY